MSAPDMLSGARFSDCRTYRYALFRFISEGARICTFIGLNPSTADETKNDATIRRCIKFAADFGCDWLVMLNLFAFRATDPKVMKRAADPVGPENDEQIAHWCARSNVVVAAWGAHGTFRYRDRAVRDLVKPLHYLRLTKDGHPAHPLYLPASLRPVRWES